MRGNTIGIIAGVIAIVGGLIVVNGHMGTSAHTGSIPDTDDDDGGSRQSSGSASAPAKTPLPSSTFAGHGSSQALPSEATIGDPKTSKVKITLGYSIDDNVAKNPSLINQSIRMATAWAKMHPGTSVQVVNTDVPASMRTDPGTASVQDGLTINGKAVPVAGQNGEVTPPALRQALSNAASPH